MEEAVKAFNGILPSFKAVTINAMKSAFIPYPGAFTDHRSHH